MNLEIPHRRYNPLNGQWVLVSPHRAKRPWSGQNEDQPVEALPEYDPNCYLCPTNTRNSGITNDDYQTTFVFDNDFAALLPPANPSAETCHENQLFIAEEVPGLCRVVCFSPKHNCSLPEMTTEEILPVIHTWAKEIEEIGQRDYINYVQVFENKGAVMGCSQPHPHSQIWATGHMPTEPENEAIQLTKYLKEHGSCLLCDYLLEEQIKKERIVLENDSFTVLVPFWAVWPFETLLLANQHVHDMPSLSLKQRTDLAEIIRQLTIRYDNLFRTSFPYSMGFHGQPTDGKEHPEWHFHAHYYPPLLRSATVKKFMVGFEMLGMPQRDITAEVAAERLRQLDSVHYKSLR
jgi:UDPglucose--hexose-1-phosphate uridylyltransferase